MQRTAARTGKLSGLKTAATGLSSRHFEGQAAFHTGTRKVHWPCRGENRSKDEVVIDADFHEGLDGPYPLIRLSGVQALTTARNALTISCPARGGSVSMTVM